MVAASPGNPGGALAAQAEDAQPPNSNSSTTFFHQYVDLGSLALTSSGGAQNGGRERCQSMLITDSEDDTHIYETPKYLRREKATTMRLKGMEQTPPPPPQGRGTVADQQTTTARRYASMTLPKEFCSSVKNKCTQ